MIIVIGSGTAAHSSPSASYTIIVPIALLSREYRMSLIQQVLPFFLIGARNTLIYCFVSFPLALLLGLLLALMRSSRIAWFSSPAKIYIEVIRDTPIIVQIFLIYYGIGAVLAIYDLAKLDNAWTAGIAILAINYAAYEAEVFRAG